VRAALIVYALTALLFATMPEAVANDHAAVRFEEVGERAGARTTHQGRKFIGKHAEVLRMFTTGGTAAAVGDFNNDGLADLFVTDAGEGRPNHLLVNQGDFRFEEKAEELGVDGGNEPETIVTDALWLDYDNDGFQDLLVARFGTPILYHNEQGRGFRDVTKGSGLDEHASSIAAIALDYDNDGRLDILLGHYFAAVNLFQLESTKVLPTNLDDAVNGGGLSLWRNVNGRSFENVTKQAGLGHHSGWTLDLGSGDFDNDGLPDFYAACDYGTDRIFFNNGDGTFRDATETVIGFDTKKGMNVDVADYNNDGSLDVYVTNITDEYMKECNMLWHNGGDGTFTDVSKETQTCATGWGWAAKFADFDNDGWRDLYVVNGLRSAGASDYIPKLLEMIIRPGVDFSDLGSWPEIGGSSWSGYQKSMLLRNRDGAVFENVAEAAGVDNDLDGRGIAIGDFDNDGRLDVYQTNADQASLLYRNVGDSVGSWLQLKLTGAKSNRDGIGARIEVRAAEELWVAEIDGGAGYAGQSMRRAHFGLGETAALDSVVVRWPSGRVDRINPPLNRLSHVKEGRGIVPAP